MSTGKEPKDFEVNGKGSDPQIEMSSLRHVQTQGSVVLTPEMFERLYLSPPNRVNGNLRRIIGNPTPFALAGFIIAFSPLVFSFLGWRQFTGGPTSTIGAFYFQGGLLPIIGAIFELILGNTFSACYFAVYGAWFLGYGATFTPDFGSYLAYSPDPSNPRLGMLQPGFLSGQAYWALLMSIFSIYITICCFRTNICLVINFFSLFLIFLFVAISFWLSVDGKTTTAHHLQLGAGYVSFIALDVDLYALLSLLFLTVNFLIQLPIRTLASSF
ncbi:Protein alcS [Cercospora beticola]|uniref:Protein alcS n=1 Tax=Cercospora beticola TaxID=122368 RepID=A0A2G5HLM3_CERBT|nr:Protein alcS [Cercospora beticola]PIA93418.1 Protein alcS [Cercospora beticola]WPB02409.1 hypothetical protein RHO25_007043 [Cercospora beticola]CAK1362703.1 unnamed protein product [Cercospora beticola]